jgi:leader peptidase (prepilin peptidase) / N-methyltransferase
VTATLVVVCSVVGLVVGALLPVVIERVPAKVPVLAGPFPEPARSLRTATGWGVTVGTAVLFGATAARFGADWVLPAYLVLVAALMALSVIDLRLFLLPNRIVFPLAVGSVVLLGLGAVAEGEPGAYGRALAAAVVAFLVFALLHVVSPRSMGFGDVKLSFVLGLYLGYLGWGEVVLGLFLGFLYGAVIGIALILTGVRTRKDHVPFGPFLAAGTLTAVLVGQAVLDWWQG